MKVLEVPIDNAVGLTLAHDLTGITPGGYKGAVLRRGHVIGEADLEVLRNIGKSHLKILELSPHEVHEDEAAERLGRMLAGHGLEVTLPGEAWANVVVVATGLLKVDVERLRRLNLLADVLAATRHTNSPLKVGEVAAKVKVRGLAVEEDVLKAAERLAAGPVPVMQVLPYRAMQVGAVITGREIYEGRIKDAFAPLLRRRLEEYGSSLVHTEIVVDEVPKVSRAISSALAAEVDMVFVTGGGSPDDCTSESIGRSADQMVFHGVPVSPGAMGVLAYAGDVPILGVPAGLLARSRGFLDLILPRLLAGERLGPEEAAEYGHGGLCLGCKVCVFPSCPFGK